jgi:hypothetical protein
MNGIAEGTPSPMARDNQQHKVPTVPTVPSPTSGDVTG